MNNAVELIGWYGGDVEHACSAWCSTGRDLTDERRARLSQFLAQLARDGHHTPFEKSALHFVYRADVATRIQLLKHRIGVSLNEESARYKRLKESTPMVPEDWPPAMQQELEDHFHRSHAQYLRAFDSLRAHFVERGMEDTKAAKRAKESARFFLPYCTQTHGDLQFNFRSFVHFLKLRMDSHAQLEIREMAEEMVRQVRGIPGDPFRYSLEAFGYGGIEAAQPEVYNGQ